MAHKNGEKRRKVAERKWRRGQNAENDPGRCYCVPEQNEWGRPELIMTTLLLVLTNPVSRGSQTHTYKVIEKGSNEEVTALEQSCSTPVWPVGKSRENIESCEQEQLQQVAVVYLQHVLNFYVMVVHAEKFLSFVAGLSDRETLLSQLLTSRCFLLWWYTQRALRLTHAIISKPTSTGTTWNFHGRNFGCIPSVTAFSPRNCQSVCATVCFDKGYLKCANVLWAWLSFVSYFFSPFL